MEFYALQLKLLNVRHDISFIIIGCYKSLLLEKFSVIN